MTSEMRRPSNWVVSALIEAVYTALPAFISTPLRIRLRFCHIPDPEALNELDHSCTRFVILNIRFELSDLLAKERLDEEVCDPFESTL